MKINFIVPEISRTGGMRVIFEYANRLTSLGHDIILYSPIIPFNNYKGMLVPYFLKYRFNYAKAFLLKKKGEPENIYERKFEIKYLLLFNNYTVRDADVTVATSWTTSYVVNNFRKQKGRKFYLVQDYEKWNSNITYVDNSYMLPLTRITVSQYLKEFLLNKFGSHSEVILNGIDFEKFDNPPKKFNDPKTILFMDHSLENKNTKAAIDTVIRLKLKYPMIRFKCFGFKKYHQMPEYIEFTENPDDEEIVNLYRSSDIFLYSSKYEGFGLPPAEAMACRCAVVGNKVAALPEYSENMVSAILTSPENPNELFKGAEYLINDEAELKRISDSGYEYVRQKLNWDNSTDKFEKLISR